MYYTVVFIVYLAGVIFGLAIILILIYALLAVLDYSCDFFCLLFREEERRNHRA